MYKLIILDDESLILDYLRVFVDWSIYELELVAMFEDSYEALEYVKKNHVDVILTDIKMPEPSGIDIAKFCCDNFPEIKIVFMSGYRDFEYAKEAIKFNVVDYIIKPIVYEEFCQTFEKLVTHYREGQNSSLTNATIRMAKKYIAEQCGENVTAEHVASHVSLNPVYFRSFFKKHTKENFIDYLSRVRMQKAKQLLDTTDLTIANICEMCGYRNKTHFYKVFKATYGVTPANYRNDFRGD